MTIVLPPSPSRAANVIAWGIQILLALAFLAAASAKLMGVPMLVEEFQRIGLGQSFRYVTAIVEIVGAVALLVPGFAAPGALWLGFTMCCAVVVHVLILSSSPAGAIVLAVLCAGVFWLRRDQLSALRERFR